MTGELLPETLARRAIEDAGYEVQNANIVFRANCPNIDLIVYGKDCAIYVQVKSSRTPASKDHVTIDGSPWSQGQLDGTEPIYNKKEGFRASFVVLVEMAKNGSAEFYVATPETLTDLVRPKARAFAARLKRDGSKRSIGFRKVLPRELLQKWRNAWGAFEEPVRSTVSGPP